MSSPQTQDDATMKDADAGLLHRVVIALERIADALEQSEKPDRALQLSESDACDALPRKYRPHATRIVELVGKLWSEIKDTDTRGWKALVAALKDDGIVAQSTYYRDVRFWEPIHKMMRPRR